MERSQRSAYTRATHLAGFRAILNDLIQKRGGYGEQSRIAKAIGVTPQYINAISKGHKNPSMKVQGDIALYFGFEDPYMFFQGGQAILNNIRFFPHAPLFSRITDPTEKGHAIVEQAERELGISGYVSSRSLLLDDFIAGNISEADLYHGIRDLAGEVFAHSKREENSNP